MDMTWPEYLRALSNNQSAIARAAGVNTGTVSRWVSGQSLPKAEQVINVARAFDESPLAALVAAGYLDDAEIPSGMVMPRMLQLRRFSDVELAKEVYARALARRDGPLEPSVFTERPGGKVEGVSAVAATFDSDDEDEDFDVAPDAGERQGTYGLAAKRGVRKVDEPHAE
jgi:transcriptional regulator with XRE-family HTH domain